MEAYKEIIEKIKPEFDKTVVFLERELQVVRTGRASPALVENVVVDCFGQVFPLKQLAAISVPEPKQILIEPWDKSYFDGIIAALKKTGIGANPIADQDNIRINLPPLTEEYRKSLIHLISEKQEDARRVMRKWRDEAWSQVQAQQREGKIREDDKFRAKEDLQEQIDEYNERIEAIGERKRKEIEI